MDFLALAKVVVGVIFLLIGTYLLNKELGGDDGSVIVFFVVIVCFAISYWAWG